MAAPPNKPDYPTLNSTYCHGNNTIISETITMMSDKNFSCIISVFLSLIFFLTIITVDNLKGPVFFTAETIRVDSLSDKRNAFAENANHRVNLDVVIQEKQEKIIDLAVLDVQSIEQRLPTLNTVNTVQKKIQTIHPVKKQIDNAELHCLALNNYFEARGESTTGQHAVANVVLNRVKHKGFPDSICGVVKQGGKKLYRCQFSWWCDGLSDEPHDQTAWKLSLKIASDILQKKHEDITSGALWYHADYVSPYWRTSMNEGPKIGRHIFYSARKPSKPSKTKTTETT
jgi:spore germination cell wall hydrolase CwlJ-like protein